MDRSENPRSDIRPSFAVSDNEGPNQPAFTSHPQVRHGLSLMMRILAWTSLSLVLVIGLLAARIACGLREDPQITELQKRALISYNFERPTQSDWKSIFWAGVMGRSARNILTIVFVDPASDADVKWIADHARNIKWLSLRGSTAKSESLEQLATCRWLRILDLSETACNDQNAAKLASHLRDLRRFVLSGTQITDAAIPSLERMPNLIFVNAWNTALTEEAVELWKQRRSAEQKLEVWIDRPAEDEDVVPEEMEFIPEISSRDGEAGELARYAVRRG